MIRGIGIILCALLMGGCASTQTEIISKPPGAHIEINNEYVGDAPITVSLPQSLGTMNETIVRALPSEPGQYVQTKTLLYNDEIPGRMIFIMDLHLVAPK